ncbi:hypothetical protein PLESTB_001347700 [Pleodorina starrii]|uniref:Serine aminopeptidase S33 domain-containing protein n=1 Tax=Pleodorina starrii TaxID=330485 RepID=A0A9W6F6Q5_9CHLO|nr:hypothetical protein PLESTM_000896200 [Pleodorina starrii]GLC58334.1 hypothetical protein PLESTB_001347700 [Pleodorina starrii]GLC69425.1 hypothetical protein PLESTF_000829400 [Pleodorina starrii]
MHNKDLLRVKPLPLTPAVRTLIAFFFFRDHPSTTQNATKSFLRFWTFACVKACVKSIMKGLGARPEGGLSGVFKNRRGQKLNTFTYTRCAPQAILFLHHGLAEHCGRYDKVCRFLEEHGIAVYAYDAHGHGKSEPLAPDSRALVNSYTHLVDDLCDFMDFSLKGQPAQQSAAQQQPSSAQQAGPQPVRPRLPVFLLGHSMGGLVAALTCLRRQDQVSGLMLHSPALDVEWTPVLRAQAAVGSLLSLLIPRARVVPAVRPEDLSSDPALVAEYMADPLNTVGPVRARTANEMLRGFGEMRRHARELRLPVYVCHGTRDAITSASASRRFVEGPGGVSSVDRVFRPVAGGYHELLHGPEWEDCARALLEWMAAHGARLQLQPQPGTGEGGEGEGGALRPEGSGAACGAGGRAGPQLASRL